MEREGGGGRYSTVIPEEKGREGGRRGRRNEVWAGLNLGEVRIYMRKSRRFITRIKLSGGRAGRNAVSGNGGLEGERFIRFSPASSIPLIPFVCLFGVINPLFVLFFKSTPTRSRHPSL